MSLFGGDEHENRCDAQHSPKEEDLQNPESSRELLWENWERFVEERTFELSLRG